MLCVNRPLEVHELFELLRELTENEFVLTCTCSAFVCEIPAVELAIDMFMAIVACIRLQYHGRGLQNDGGNF